MERQRAAGLLFLAFLAGRGPAAAEPPALVPEVAVRMSAARYVPTEVDLHWVGWIGVRAGLLRFRGTTFDFAAEVETILGDTRRPFEATQANYHLTPSLRRPFGRVTGALFFHHVSRHYVDRDKEPAVDWNILGVRLAGSFSESGPRGHWEFGVGHTTLASFVGYEWEVTAALDVGFPADNPAPYVRLDARLVTVGEDSELDRGSFVDASAEAGLRVGTPSRNFQVFAAAERRNDVFLEVPGRLDRVLFGLRINYLAP